MPRILARPASLRAATEMLPKTSGYLWMAPDTHAPPSESLDRILGLGRGVFWKIVFRKSRRISPFLDQPMPGALFPAEPHDPYQVD